MFRTVFNLVFVLYLLLLTASCGIRETPQPMPSATPQVDVSKPTIIETNAVRWDKTTAKDFLTISELKKKNPRDGVYETEGYIVNSVPKCNCPPGQNCKCDPASITISEVFETPGSKEVGEKELRILTNPKGLGGDQKYRFKIKIPESYSDDEKIDDVFLVAYRAPKKTD